LGDGEIIPHLNLEALLDQMEDNSGTSPTDTFADDVPACSCQDGEDGVAASALAETPAESSGVERRRLRKLREGTGNYVGGDEDGRMGDVNPLADLQFGGFQPNSGGIHFSSPSPLRSSWISRPFGG